MDEELEILPQYQMKELVPENDDQFDSLSAMTSRMREFLELLPNCRAKSLAITSLDETFLWAGYAISHGELTNPKRDPKQIPDWVR